MRSTFFKTPFEYQIETSEEEWTQGDLVEGRLTVRNLGQESTALKEARLCLAHGVRKEIKTGNPDAWKVTEEKILFMDLKLEALEEQHINWNIQLKTDCSITEKASSFFLIFGGENALKEGGRIDLKISLHPILQSFLQTFTTQFNFFEKYRKTKGDWTEVKLDPPDSKEFPKLDYVLFQIRIREEQLEADFRFKMKSFGREGEKMKVVNKKREFQLRIIQSEYLQEGGFPNRKLFREKILEALNVAKLKFI